MEQGEFERRLATAETCWAAVVLLLERLRGRPPDDSPRTATCSRYDTWSELSAEVAEHFERNPSDGELAAHDRERIATWTSGGSDLDAVDAVAWGIDVAAAGTFPTAWRDELCRAGATRHQLRAGQLYPVADPAWPMPGRRPSSRPCSVNDVLHGELPHVRAHRDAGVDVIAEFGFGEALAPVFGVLDRVATVHPNETLLEFDFPAGARTFPVTVRDPRRQLAVAMELIERAIDEGARLVLLPELSATREIVDAIERRLIDEERDVIVVAGSLHCQLRQRRVNRSETIVAGIGRRISHTKIVPFRDEVQHRPASKEGIDNPRRPSLTIHHADHFRFCVVICKDYIDSALAAVLDRVAANVICIPAMSHKTDPFVARAHAHVVDAQSLSLIANGPISWSDDARPKHTIIGRPIAGDPVESYEIASAPDVQVARTYLV